jgi:hypothetical protein
MRNFQVLDHVSIDSETETIQLEHTDSPHDPILVLQREGPYMNISASYGPLEIALRPRLEDFTRTITRLQAVEGLHITRQIGTTEAYIGAGLNTDGELLLRPTIVADATGHLSLNLRLTVEVTKAIQKWLQTASVSA